MSEEDGARPFDVRQVIARDAIPSVDEPEAIPLSAYDGDLEEDVLSLQLGGAARAYPIRYLHFHEIVNDEIEGVPVAVTWCPLCGSAVVYERRVTLQAAKDPDADAPSNQQLLTFGVSGKLAADDLVMYDRETESEWKQSLGRAISGPLAGVSLDVLPAAMTTLGAFADAHPDGEVLAAPGGESEAAGEGPEPEPIDYDEAPYDAYFEMAGFGLDAHRGGGGRSWDRTDIAPKTVVIGLEEDGEALGVPLPVVREAGGVVSTTVGDQPVVVFATDDGIHAFANPDYSWERSTAGFRATRPDGTGALYDGATGNPVDAPAAHTGESGSAAADPLDRLPARRLFAFTWQDDHGADSIFTL